KAVRDMLEHRQVRKQSVILKHEADVTLVRRQRGDVSIAEANASRVRCFKSCDHTQRCGLAAARRAQQREEFARPHVEADLAHGVDLALDAMREALGYALDSDAGLVCAHRAHPPSMLVIETAPGARNRRSTRPMMAITTNTITTTS